MKDSKASPSTGSPSADDLYVALARRDGGWKCAYCGAPLAPLGESPARIPEPAHWYYFDCPQHRDHTPCWHPEARRIAPGYEMPADDHVIPKSRGGSHDISNRVLACYPCNGRKGAKLLSELPPGWATKRRSPHWVEPPVLPA